MRIKKKSKPVVRPIVVSDSVAGEEWLAQLTEPEFRDRILSHLFTRMKKAALIESFQNIHGRNDKGIDYLIAERTSLHRRILGVQVKSKPITRTGDGSTLSSIEIKRECEAAIMHEFVLEKDSVRLDNVALWTSARITEDAEKEFNAPGGTLKVQVMKSLEVFALLERFCHELLVKIPQCALSQYVLAKANPAPKAFKLLGIPLNPKTHFLAPELSRNDVNASARLTSRKGVIAPNHENLDLSSILTSAKHVIIAGGDLSGKSYLLEHLQSVVAQGQSVPFLLSPTNFTATHKTVFQLLTKQLPSYSARDIEELGGSTRIVLLVDDIDRLETEEREQLLGSDPSRLLIVGTSARAVSSPHIDQFYIVGVDLSSIPQFLRSLDTSGSNITFTDRAHSFIARSLASSGLPSNPFTVAMLLAECQVSPTKFSTPTMGRLIERFIENQLGSHADSRSLVDFETKREFLIRLAGRGATELSIVELRRLLIKHIHSRSLPHDVNSFVEDLLNDGVFTISAKGDSLTWSHPVIKKFFFVRNLVGKGKLEPIVSVLRREFDVTLAAIVGSQVKNASPIINKMIGDIERISMPSAKEVIKAALGPTHNWLPDEQDEAAMLKRIETVETNTTRRKELVEEARERTKEFELTDADRKRIEQEAMPLVRRIIEEKCHVAYNLASVVVNARDTRTADKERTVRQVLRSNIRFGLWLQDLCRIVYKDRTRIVQMSSWLRYYASLHLSDTILGDPFLLTVFQNLLKGKRSDDEALLLCDLLLGCGSEHHETLVSTLRRINIVEITSAMYFRILALYFFRYHREQERKSLRKLLAELRELHKFVSLPNVPAPR
jgi:hypothetical protein